jgi:hypothetical protein
VTELVLHNHIIVAGVLYILTYQGHMLHENVRMAHNEIDRAGTAMRASPRAVFSSVFILVNWLHRIHFG